MVISLTLTFSSISLTQVSQNGRDLRDLSVAQQSMASKSVQFNEGLKTQFQQLVFTVYSLKDGMCGFKN
jgi:hypothetical protein